ncbi:MAG: hypothetical protein L0387_28080 [Acidobacteria bacterium]|nr:hypothetical protein [Acidobacteriota bacterium]MCI0722244.1 hypothetical protein [Acidobacteriota bacterium]
MRAIKHHLRWLGLLFLLSNHIALAQTDLQGSNPQGAFRPLNTQEKFDYYLRRTFGPHDLLKRSALAGIAQWRNHPLEWEQGLAGYGRRFSSSYGQHAIKKTIQFSIGAALKEDPRYFASADNGFWRRTGHAVAHTMIVRNDHNRRVFSFGRLSGTLGGSFISRTWHPERQQTVGNALRNIGVSLSAEASWNVLREFWPEIKRIFGKGKQHSSASLKPTVQTTAESQREIRTLRTSETRSLPLAVLFASGSGR